MTSVSPDDSSGLRSGAGLTSCKTARKFADFADHPPQPRIAPVSITLTSVITCPECGAARQEAMPTNACQWFYECTSCHAVLDPLPGDCCVYCSYGTVQCPPIQQGNACCNGSRRLKQ